MSDLLTPKEQLTAYERWELPSFDEGGIRVSGNPNGIKLPTAAELEEMRNQAHDEAYQAGHAEGHAAGHAAGYAAGYGEGAQKVAEEQEQLAALVTSMGQLAQQTDQQIAQGLLDLALELAQQMVRQTLKVRPEVLLDVINDAIRSLPHFNPGAHLVLHPADAEMVRERMGEQLAHSGWKIFEDAQISRGGVKIETANSQIDATVETRWARITANMGQESSWLEE